MNRGVMTLPQLNLYRRDRGRRALITLAGETGLKPARRWCACPR
ncbi:hypothetical protein SAMN04487981_102505 [Streptomyces sp. cf386]|nr:hypothetical protein SAMN04487981_102505 [Streptomyces sp. cf386]